MQATEQFTENFLLLLAFLFFQFRATQFAEEKRTTDCADFTDDKIRVATSSVKSVQSVVKKSPRLALHSS